ncbi:MAG: hypothetical protein E6K75_07630 [Candidatus Eisenbacteria bacterium]|uniref:Uncharacterized protein n=1 Tax=Eiseniibacteriota bacterium TaxID=2212470 RepID=A0A538SZV3_UNCEI|nr:MAG: hypothetical protein E6K75_07630 [Candidatus Eisenbacteria bacterium]
MRPRERPTKAAPARSRGGGAGVTGDRRPGSFPWSTL